MIRDSLISSSLPEKPNLLLLSGLDPSGGAGLQADILTTASLGFHSLPVMTVNTVQNGDQALSVIESQYDWLAQQLDALLSSFPIHGVKIGLLQSESLIPQITQFLVKLKIDNTRIPVVFDPVLKAGGGGTLSSIANGVALKSIAPLLRESTLVTPNLSELSRLTRQDVSTAADEAQAVAVLQGHGAAHVLVTKADSAAANQNAEITSHLYGLDENNEQRLVWEFYTKRIDGGFRGTGCTLSTAVACYLAKGLELQAAIELAGQFVKQAIIHAYRPLGSRLAQAMLGRLSLPES